MKQALVMTERFFGKNIDYAVTEHSLALISEKLGRQEKALEYMKMAITDLSAIIGPEHDRVKLWKQELADMGRSGE